MARFIVGGRELDLTKDEVVRRMRDVRPELVRKHVIEISGTEFPPKQVLEQVTGWDRRSYTTMEANRVLTRLGLPSRRAADEPGSHEELGKDIPVTFARRLSAVEAALSVAQEAIAALRDRVSKLETK